VTDIDDIVRRLQRLEGARGGLEALTSERRGDYDWTDLESDEATGDADPPHGPSTDPPVETPRD
jgi:hypothetical protein